MKDQKHKHGFTVPDGYFDNFEGRLFDTIKSRELPKDTGFVVPEGYFENLEDTIIQKLNISEKPTKVFKLSTKSTVAYVLAVAACVVLIFTVATKNESTVQQIDSLKVATIENYIDEGYLDLESFDLLALLNDDDLINMNLENDLFSEESLETYLLEQPLEETLLIE